MKYNGIEVKDYLVHEPYYGLTVHCTDYEDFNDYVKEHIKRVKYVSFDFSDDCFHAYMSSRMK